MVTTRVSLYADVRDHVFKAFLPFNVRGLEILLFVVVAATAAGLAAVDAEEDEDQEYDHGAHNGTDQVFGGHMV